MKIVEENRATHETIFYYAILTPKFLEKKEALLLKKSKRDFPENG